MTTADTLLTQVIINNEVASFSTQHCPVLQTAMLAGADESLSEVAFQYGRNVGLAFQLVDDLLDFVSSSAAMGKPTAADLKLGLATAPVLFACERVRT
jgi:decaprenyl-diphosphate synthase subunit 1